MVVDASQAGLRVLETADLVLLCRAVFRVHTGRCKEISSELQFCGKKWLVDERMDRLVRAASNSNTRSVQPWRLKKGILERTTS